MCLSDVAQDFLGEVDGRMAGYYQFSILLCMLDLDNMLQLSFRSYIPLDSENDRYYSSVMPNCKILLRLVPE